MEQVDLRLLFIAYLVYESVNERTAAAEVRNESFLKSEYEKISFRFNSDLCILCQPVKPIADRCDCQTRFVHRY